MRNEEIFIAIDNLKEEYLNFLIDLTKIESPTSYKKGVDDACNLVIQKALKKGWAVEVLNEKSVGNPVCITMNGHLNSKPIILSGHMDTVHPIGTIKTSPVKIDGDKLYGPGVYDCKGGIIAGFMVMDALEKIGFNSRPIKLVIQTDEENSSILSDKRTVKFMAEKSKDALAFFNLEPYVKGFVSTARKGIIRYEFTVKGISAHSANCPDGVSALTEACHKIIELEKLKDKDGITCNVGIINGGTVANTVPDTCTFVADVRFASKEQLDYVENLVNKICNNSTVAGATATVKQVSFRTSMEENEQNLNLLSKVNEILQRNGFEKLTARRGAGGSDAADMTAYGITTLDSLGVSGKNMHSPDEYALISSFVNCAKMLAVITLEL
ncbi:MAG: M20 family metallopeptidase [Clostridiales bacterium]|nr:M20 family metallopeptidase [Clostridiales bacterium]